MSYVPKKTAPPIVIHITRGTNPANNLQFRNDKTKIRHHTHLMEIIEFLSYPVTPRSAYTFRSTDVIVMRAP